MNRRLFLKGIGGAALAAPFLSSLRPVRAQSMPTPRRMVIYYTNNGCLTNRWFPKVEDGAIDADALAGTTLAGLMPFASKLLFPRGLAMFPRGFNVSVDGVTYFDPHDQGMGSKLTCAPIDPTGDHWALSHSLDHEIAGLVNQGTKSPLVLSVGGGGYAPSDVKHILSYSAAKEPYAPETNPGNVYKTLTGLFPATGDGEADYRIKRGQSIIDLVSEDLNGFKKLKMSAADQQRIDDWLALLRETEQQVIPATCNEETATALGITADAVSASTKGYDMATAFTLGGDMMIKLIALTMMCDNNRSIVMHWPGYATFKWDGLTHEYDHHGLSHRNGSAAVGGTCVSGVLDRIAEIDNWYAGRYVKLVELLDSITEGDGKLLDSTACMWLPELADGNAHNNENLPIVIAGSCGGYLKQGLSVNLTGKTLGTGNSEASCTTDGAENSGNTGSPYNIATVPLNKLYVTLINAVGGGVQDFTPVESFGTWDTNSGPGITNPGELTALKA